MIFSRRLNTAFGWLLFCMGIILCFICVDSYFNFISTCEKYDSSIKESSLDFQDALLYQKIGWVPVVKKVSGPHTTITFLKNDDVDFGFTETKDICDNIKE